MNGTPIYTVKHARDRSRFFSDCRAYMNNGKIYVRSERCWNSKRWLRKHELFHVTQERILGRRLFNEWYEKCNRVYYLNPFEITAWVACLF